MEFSLIISQSVMLLLQYFIVLTAGLPYTLPRYIIALNITCTVLPLLRYCYHFHCLAVLQEGSYADALSKFEHLRQTTGGRADIMYGLAVCQYQLKDYKSVVTNCTHVISSAAKEHPGDVI